VVGPRFSFPVRTALVTVLVAAMMPLAWTPSAAAVTAWPTLTTTDSITGFDLPTTIVSPDDGSGRMFVTEQKGLIRLVKGGLLAGTALDIRDLVSFGGERGLLGLAFPPGFGTKQYAYVYFTGAGGAISVMRVRISPTDPDMFDRSSMQSILSFSHPVQNHNGGQMAFGPGGYLFIGTGDGGGAGDPRNLARNVRSLNGKILRIDVESTPASPGYRIPRTNPFAGRRGRRAPRKEIWAWGLRNPWRFSIDAPTNTLWIGDVGQNRYEEIDRVVLRARGGYDFGWSRYEGNRRYKARRLVRRGYTWPVAAYSHAEGDSVTGGYVYRGSTYPTMSGLYFFGDFERGKIWGLARDGGKWVRRLLLDTPHLISTFGLDGAGELWYADYSGGVIYRLGTP
jgi:glucose/arabinose dehydrogenase